MVMLLHEVLSSQFQLLADRVCVYMYVCGECVCSVTSILPFSSIVDHSASPGGFLQPVDALLTVNM